VRAIDRGQLNGDPGTARFSHPDARYFAVGKLNKDQIQDSAERKGMSVSEVERWLGPNLAYEPESREAVRPARSTRGIAGPGRRTGSRGRTVK
jgi:hypothetical protein